jgi:hypothetical protein
VRRRGDENHPIYVIEAITHEAGNDARRALYALLSGPKLRRLAARSAAE